MKYGKICLAAAAVMMVTCVLRAQTENADAAQVQGGGTNVVAALQTTAAETALRLDKVEKGLDEMGKRLGTRVVGGRRPGDSIEEQLSDLEKRLKKLERDVDDLERRVRRAERR